MLIDIACNITSYKVNEHDTLIAHCREKNTMPVLVGTDVDTSMQCLRMCKRYGTMCYVGIHPTASSAYVRPYGDVLDGSVANGTDKPIVRHGNDVDRHVNDMDKPIVNNMNKPIVNDADRRMNGTAMASHAVPCTDSVLDRHAQLAVHEMASHEHVLAIGECGLDYDRLSFSDKHAQLTVLDHLLSMQYDHYFLHSRNAHADLLTLMHRHGTRGVVHSFTGTRTELLALLDCGLYIGINGCTFKKETDIFACLPMNRVLIETDAPYCNVGRSYFYWHDGMTRVRRYRSGNVDVIYGLVSRMYGVSVDVMESVVERNFVDLYGEKGRACISRWLSH